MKKPIQPKRPIFQSQEKQYQKDLEVYEEYKNQIDEVKQELVDTIIQSKSLEELEIESSEVLEEIKEIVNSVIPVKKKTGRKKKGE